MFAFEMVNTDSISEMWKNASEFQRETILYDNFHNRGVDDAFFALALKFTTWSVWLGLIASSIISRQKFFKLFPLMDRQDLKSSNGPAEIFQALLNARDNGWAIGIRAGSSESEVLVTAVEDIELNENGTFIILKHFDSNGYILPSRRLALDDIQSVLPFSTVFENPYLQSISRDKTWFF